MKNLQKPAATQEPEASLRGIAPRAATFSLRAKYPVVTGWATKQSPMPPDETKVGFISAGSLAGVERKGAQFTHNSLG